jgi:O-antigen/teichoic acid export membrane protein
MTGTTIAQAIPIAISPILTRIYTPEDFGVFALYMSIASIIAAVATGRYELAIMLPKKDEDAVNIVVLSIGISFMISVFCFLIIYIFNSDISSLFENSEISTWLYFIPFTVMLTGLYQSFNFWHNRSKNYKNLSKARIMQSTTTAGTNLTMGTLIMGPIGLVLGNLFGQITSIFYLAKKTYLLDKKVFIENISFIKILTLAKRYKKFPQYDALATLFNISAHQSAHIFFNIFFGAISSGYYYLVQKIFGLPILLIAASIQDVFKEKMTIIYNSGGNSREFFINTLKKLFLLALIPSVLIYFFAVDVFMFFFGEQWKSAGEFVQILTPAFFLRFISFPLSFMFYIAEKQHYNIIGQFLLLVVILFSFLLGKNYGVTFTVELISIFTSIFYLSYLYLSYQFTSKGK